MSGPSPADRPSHVWVDGRILPADGAHVSAFDRGFQLGDGIFETLRARGGRVTELAEHLARLGRSAAGLDIDLPADVDDRIRAGIARGPRDRGPRRAGGRCLRPDHRHPRRPSVAGASCRRPLRTSPERWHRRS